MPRRLLQNGYRWILVGFLLLAIGTGAALYLSDRQGAQTDHKICVAVGNINAVIREQLERSKVNIPKIAYFKQHPVERAQQLQEIDRALLRFRSDPC